MTGVTLCQSRHLLNLRDLERLEVGELREGGLLGGGEGFSMGTDSD